MRYALRSLAKTPGFTVVALVTLALGIGVNTSMFSLADALLFRVAPFPRGGELHQIYAETPQGPRTNFSEVEVRELRANTDLFGPLTTFTYQDSALVEPGKPAEQVPSVMVSPEFFATFGVQPLLGRAFTAAEYQPGSNQVILLSHAFWRQRFGGNPEIVGRGLRINGESITVIGVMPPSFDWRFLWGTTGFWRPLNYTPDQLKGRAYRTLQLIGRLPPGAPAARAAVALGPVAARQREDFPQDYTGRTYRVVPLHEAQMDREGRQILALLLGLAGFVLLIACANLANLQLARATTAAREFAIRAALGASRARLIRQQLTECVLLAIGGGTLGVLLASWLNHLLVAAVSIGGEPGGLVLELDARVLAFAFLVALGTGVVFGLVPAWLSSRADIVTILKSQSRGATTGRGHHRMRQILIVAEVFLALVLLGGAGVMQRGFDKFLHKEVGWDQDRLLTGALPMPEARFPTAPDRIAFFRKVEARLAALPGVESAALSTGIPIWDYGTVRPIFTETQGSADPALLPRASHVMITADFFRALGVPLLAGRGFAPDLPADGPRVIIINEALARQLWPGQSALGRRLASIDGALTTWSEVIGVVPNTASAADIGDRANPYQVFRPLVHEAWTWVRFAVRSEHPAALVETVRRALAEVDADLPATDVLTVRAAVDRSQHNLVVVARILQGFALLGLVLSSVGIYGVISNLVAQRTGEFGIRLALGASPADVLRLVLGHGLKLTVLGLALGLGGAYAISRLLGAIMPRLVAPDALALGLTTLLLFAVATLACWWPARRATRVDPLTALRAE